MQVVSDAIVDGAAIEDPEELLVEEISIDGLCGVY
jgi:mycofactocin precursor